MGSPLTVVDPGETSILVSSPRNPHVTNNGGGSGSTCCCAAKRRWHLLAGLVLAGMIGCATIALQLVATERSGPRHVGESMRVEFSTGGSAVVPWDRIPDEGVDEEEAAPPYADIDTALGISAPSRILRRPLVDRRFAGQKTGIPLKPDEEIPHRPPARGGPFGWGTDWVVGVALPAGTGGTDEDVIEPEACRAPRGGASFVNTVLEMRRTGHVDASNRVVACTRTKDRGRYLPEWVAYHWALGVDVMDIFDDDSVDDTRQVLEPFVRAGIVKFQSRRIRRGADTWATAVVAGASAASVSKQNSSTVIPASANSTVNDSAAGAADESAKMDAKAMKSEMWAPVKECVARYRDMHENSDPLAPRWLVLIDSDEFLWAKGAGSAEANGREAGAKSRGLAELLGIHTTTCCLQVMAVQYGTSGFSETPRGLLLENFLTHADPASLELNGPPKAMLNFLPSANSSSFPDSGDGGGDSGSDGGTVRSCRCKAAPAEALAVRRYPVTREDRDARERRYAELRQQQQQEQAAGKSPGKFALAADPGWVDFGPLDLGSAPLNEHKSDGMADWSCVVRRLLSRAAGGLHVVTGLPHGSLSPHHPIAHGYLPMDPYGDEEAGRRDACLAVARSTPTVAGTVWGAVDSLPPWLDVACNTRFVFVHSFESTGERQVLLALVRHPWVRSHLGPAALADGGCTLTSAIPAARRREEATTATLSEMCGCTNAVSPGCWRYCPKLQRELLAENLVNGGENIIGKMRAENINKTRQELVQQWLRRFNFKSEPEQPLVLVEKDPDFLVASKQGLFPFVSTSILTVRHPLCTPASAGSGGGDGSSWIDLREWRNVWEQVLTTQVPHTQGSVWVVRFEDLLAQEEEVTSTLWAAVGLPPVAPYTSAAQNGGARPGGGGGGGGGRGGAGGRRNGERGRRLILGDALSRAAPAVQERAIPLSCRLRAAACKTNPACELEMLRSASLLDFFGYGGDGELLSSQRFLWGKEELLWLGERLDAERSRASDEKGSPISMVYLKDRGRPSPGSDDEPSILLPQAPHPLKARMPGGGAR